MAIITGPGGLSAAAIIGPGSFKVAITGPPWTGYCMTDPLPAITPSIFMVCGCGRGKLELSEYRQRQRRRRQRAQATELVSTKLKLTELVQSDSACLHALNLRSIAQLPRGRQIVYI